MSQPQCPCPDAAAPPPPISRKREREQWEEQKKEDGKMVTDGFWLKYKKRKEQEKWSKKYRK